MWHGVCVNQSKTWELDIRAMAHWVLVGIASVVAIAPAHAGILHHLPEPENYALLALGLTGLTIGWFGARGRRED